ncbi:hypothetical protein CP973_08125 [Streptomyces albofaciens JCM 4342]|uniref:hypothetical protein n=1 Tax=Streptomyces albofaciens TaxID=66866 RepID=UPI0012386568|nr:hypothetical protein [Streptomyces albofaciens]KAA6221931.1 hypothetical protein CP973_08125 [Streptomyces albofaciens JCM 4342]
MPTSIMEEVEDLFAAPVAQGPGPLPETAPVPSRSARPAGAVLQCPSCGSPHVAQVLGDNGGISFVCTACGHSWS